jgi:deazaflavin-dependent oxidoreductase (nitroreductase family)
MQINQKKLESYLPLFFKYLNRFMVMMWKLGMGKLINCWPSVIGRIMVISHSGRSSGKDYLTPVNYCERDGDIYCTSAYGGGSDWFLNVVANPQIEIWLPDGWYAGNAEIVGESAERVEMLRQVLIESGFAAPLFANIDPKTMGEEEFKEATSDYRLLRIKRQSARTGADGPGSLAWLWPVITLVLLFKRRRRKK